MKKVLVLMALLAMTATPALAGIRNSPHDLSSSNGNINVDVKSTNTTQLCVFCHAPHNATTAVNAPLWNRTTKDLSTVALYNSASITSFTKPNAVRSTITSSDATLCLSCHDGSNLAGGLTNNPNGTAPTFAAGLNTVGGNAVILDGTNGLSNDHPIGMLYNSVQGAKNTEFNANPAGVKFFNGRMWCSTCHDVHNYGTAGSTQPFLRVSIDGSQLCLDCHNK